MKKVLYITLILLISIRCEEVSDQDLENINDSLLVVDGGLTNERTRHEIKLSKTFNNIDDEPQPVTDALVIIYEGTKTIFLTHDEDNPGTYKSDTLQAIFGRLYVLQIFHDEKEYTAFATAEIGTSLPNLSLLEIDNENFEFNYNETIPSMTEVSVTWNDTNSSGQAINQKKEAFFYTLDVLDITQTFAPEKESFIIPKGATIHRRKFSLTQQHQNFLRSFLSEVDWRGGAFDAAPGNVLTNLSEGAVGYFFVSMVDSDSATVD